MNHPNRLIQEKSPYLLQHAYNPVDWFPWGEEAFQKARLEDKPIFLSIGYATCHWCHVMEKESFENREVAELMNNVFINIKVDREELPEVDNLYMEFAQSMMSGSAGWPLNVILTPALEPFFASTYLPPHSRPGMMGLIELIARIQEVWTSEEKEKVLGQATKIVEVFADNIHTEGESLPEKETVTHLADLLYKLADPVYGGMKGSPKFPIGYQMLFLLRYFWFSKDARALFLAEKTLDSMQKGGIWDHLGGGFSRYSVDEEWLVPHFEKMLYDNALLMESYLEAYQVTQKPLYKEVLVHIADYILRDMTAPQGGFYSAEDADSEGEEGRFYTWEKKEVIKALGKDEGKLFCEFYGITEKGNFEGKNILHIAERIPEFAERHQIEPELVKEALLDGANKLLELRQKRERPLRDDKILVSWNALAIHSFAKAANVLGEKKYLEAALKAAYFIKKNLWIDGNLYRRYREGDARFMAGLDEYAFMIRAALTLFEIGEGLEWFEWALEMNEILETKFKSEGGAYFQTDGEDPNLLLRKSHFSDGAEPSGNAVQCENLIRFYHLTFQEKFSEQAVDIFKAVKKFCDNYPPGYTYHILNLLRFTFEGAPTFIIAKDQADFIKNTLASAYIPFKAVVFKSEAVKLWEEHVQGSSDVTLYICYKGVCESPLTDKHEIEAAIHKLAQRV